MSQFFFLFIGQHIRLVWVCCYVNSHMSRNNNEQFNSPRPGPVSILYDIEISPAKYKLAMEKLLFWTNPSLFLWYSMS